MIISRNWLKQYTDISLTTEELATTIGARLVEIEEVQDISSKYDGIVLARVVSCTPVPDSDHLNLTKLDDGGVTKDVERDEKGHVQVVCGAPNVREGLTVIWLPPGVTVPVTYSDTEPFVLGARKLRGVMSNGMIASAKELDLYDDHAGIIEVIGEYTPGTPIKEVCELDDVLFDIENKSLTHRPDTFGIIGFAREVAAIQGRDFTTPDWLMQQAPLDALSSKTGITIENADLASRYLGVVIEQVDATKLSDLALQTWLARVGVRPINQVVDVTNYLMMLTGQPLHAFDYDKLLAVNNGMLDIRVRAGKGEGDELTLLDGRTITLSSEDIVIANGEKAVALAGAMGGSETEVDANTKTLFIESASFNLFNLRATQMRHGIFSEAITRFTKGQSPELALPVLAQAVKLYAEQGAFQQGEIVDSYPARQEVTIINVSAQYIQSVLGDGTVTSDEIAAILRQVNCNVVENGNDLEITVPYWRNDLHTAEDIVEEIGRIRGFDSIVPTLAERTFTAVRPSRFDQLRTQLRRLLVSAGANELLTYSFVHGDLMRKAGQDPDNAYKIINSISPDLQYYRQALTPSLLQCVYPNSKAGYKEFALFEINKVHQKDAGMTNENVPVEYSQLGFVVSRQSDRAHAAYYDAKRYLEYLANALQLSLTYVPLSERSTALSKPFEPLRSAAVYCGEMMVGVVGEYTHATTKNYKLPGKTAGFEVDLDALFPEVQPASSVYAPLSKYPSVERDVCFAVKDEVSFAALQASIVALKLDPMLTYIVTPHDIFARDHETKNITFSIRFMPYGKTLTGSEVAEYVATITGAAEKAVGARVV